MENRRNKRQVTGKRGEDVACGLLSGKGHTILERNYRVGHLEIDIISRSSEGIHFVEVKTRCESIQAPPQENVDLAKQRRIASAAKGFLRSKKGQHFYGSECHFDVVAITITNKNTQVEYFQDAFIPIYL
jgi:putative endonuclease